MTEEESNSRKPKPKIGVLTILTVGAIVVLAGVVIRPMLQRPWVGCRGCGVVCGTNVSGLAKALKVYASDADILPPAEQWCDMLITWDFTTPKQFVCKHSDAIEGESSYAMNRNVAGRKLAGLPDDVVLLFETDFGKERGRRTAPIEDRGFYKVAPCVRPDTRVHRKRWNQAGGPEILTTEHHKGEGCNVAFVDMHVEFVETADLAKLRWKPDPNEK